MRPNIFDEQSQHDILYQLRNDSDWQGVTTRDDSWKSVKHAMAKELLGIAKTLAFIPDDGFKSKRDVADASRLVNLLLRRQDVFEKASVINDFGLLSRGRANISVLPDFLLNEFKNFRGWGRDDFQSLYSFLTRSRVSSKVRLSFKYNKQQDGFVIYGNKRWPRYIVKYVGDKCLLVELHGRLKLERDLLKMREDKLRDLLSTAHLLYEPDYRRIIIDSYLGLRSRDVNNLKFANSKERSFFVKSEKNLTRSQLFSFLVLDQKLLPSTVEKIFGLTMGDSEEIESFRYGSWNIKVDSGIGFSQDDSIGFFKNVDRILKSKGLGHLSGDILIMGSLKGRVLADYTPSQDLIRLGWNKMKKHNSGDLAVLFHELGHRNWRKFLNSNQRGFIQSEFIGKRSKTPSFFDLGLKDKDEILDGEGNLWHLDYRKTVTGMPSRRGKEYIVALLVKSNERRLDKKVGNLFNVYLAGLLTSNVSVNGRRIITPDFSEFFPTQYSFQNNHEEWYCELFSLWVMGDLRSSDVVDFMKKIH